MMKSGTGNIDVCLFFYVHGEFLIHGCTLEEAEDYGDFLIYPEGHADIWDQEYFEKYRVDYDFFPRGRVAYQKSDQSFQVLYDRCIGDDIHILIDSFYPEGVELGCDEHYQCYKCNQNYCI